MGSFLVMQRNDFTYSYLYFLLHSKGRDGKATQIERVKTGSRVLNRVIISLLGGELRGDKETLEI
jgi:hypothetical protein